MNARSRAHRDSILNGLMASSIHANSMNLSKPIASALDSKLTGRLGQNTELESN